MNIQANQRNAEATPLYDTYSLAAGQAMPTSIILFKDPVGASSKDKASTILGRPYQIGAGDRSTCWRCASSSWAAAWRTSSTS